MYGTATSRTLWKVVTPSTVPAVSLEEAKNHCRVDADIMEDDQMLVGLVAAAQGTVEKTLDRFLLDTTVQFTLNTFPGGASCGCGSSWDGFIPSGFRGADRITFPLAPVRSITTLAYVDEDGASQTIAGGSYTFSAPEADGAYVEPVWGGEWPVTRQQSGGVTVTAVVGYGPNPVNVPQELRHAMKLLIGAWYGNREDLVNGMPPTLLPVPLSATALMNLFRWRV